MTKVLIDGEEIVMSIEKFLEICKKYNHGLSIHDLEDILYKISDLTEENLLTCLRNNYIGEDDE